jgi:N6-L-threonylcarbamoyladenine synthase
MLILGIETSCDETSASVVKDGTQVLSCETASSAKELSKFGGVIPEVAARRQIECVIAVIDTAIRNAGVSVDQINAIAVTKGPGLLTSLLVGVVAARTLSSVWKKPLVGVHHTLGHLSSVWLDSDREIKFPVLALSVSGGHTEIWLRESHTKGVLLGSTRDDAAGEAFDKGAVLLGLPYPGGPALSRLAEGGNPHYIEFPRPLLGEKTCDFSYSGLKTSLKYALRDRGGLDALSDVEKRDIASGFQEAICNHLVTRVEHAIELHPGINEVHLVGGVSANKRLRSLVEEKCRPALALTPALKYCTDNSAMIASAGSFMIEEIGDKAYVDFETEASLVLS